LRKITVNILICIFIIHIVYTSNFLIIGGSGALKEIDPKFGDAPKIDGYINRSVNEWHNATKVNTYLYTNLSNPVNGLLINLWVMQSELDLYISIQFELDIYPNEFVGILISESVSEDEDKFEFDDFEDAKIVQFSDLGGGNEKVEYEDNYISDAIFKEDPKSNGNGTAVVDEKKHTYEFIMPVNNSDEKRDIFLDFGEGYAFKIVHGEYDGNSYKDSIDRSSIVIIYIQYLPPPPPIDPIELIVRILLIISFSALGALYGFYIYKVVLLKKKVERVKG